MGPQMVYRYPTRHTQVSVRERRQAGIDVSSTAPRNQSTVGSLLAGPGSTGGTLHLCTAGRAHVHMEDCRKLYPLVVATLYTRWPLISVLVSECCCLEYWSAQQRLTLFRVQISGLLTKRSQCQPNATFNVLGKRGIVCSFFFWISKVSCCRVKLSRLWAGGKARREWCAQLTRV